MKFSLTGTAANGMPVNSLVEFPDEAAVRAYADAKGITVSRIEIVPERLRHRPPENIPRKPWTDGDQVAFVGCYLFAVAWLCLALGIASIVMGIATNLPMLLLGQGLIPLSLFLFLIAAIYRVGGSIVQAIERK